VSTTAPLNAAVIDDALTRLLRAERRQANGLAILVPLIAVLGALVVGAALIRVDGANPLTVYGEVWRGIFGTRFGRADTAIQATPLILLGLGLMLAYRAKVFTIGAEGQYLIGAVGSVAWATAGGIRDLPGPLLIVTSMIVGAICGALWGAVPGVLNARFGTSVVIASLLLNYIGAATLAWAVRVGIRDPAGFVSQSRVVGRASVPLLGSSRVHLGFLIALAVVPLLSVLLRRSRIGLRMDVLGDNPEALAANETPPARMVLLVLLGCGALAGLAGFLQVSGVTARVNSSFGAGYGFTAIVVALLGRLRPVGILLAALGISALTIGFEVAERKYQVPSATVGVIQALIVVFFVAGDALASRRSPGLTS
jgi:ABC-type uncharacterized transport system permease subunit